MNLSSIYQEITLMTIARCSVCLDSFSLYNLELLLVFHLMHTLYLDSATLLIICYFTPSIIDEFNSNSNEI